MVDFDDFDDFDDITGEERDITETVDSIIEALEPLLLNKIEECGEDGIPDFVASMFAATIKLCIDVNVDRRDAKELFQKLWEISAEQEEAFEKEETDPSLLN